MTTRFNGKEAGEGAANPHPTSQFNKQPNLVALTLTKGDRVEDRFLVQEAISLESGEADIFRCLDEQTGEEIALKFYHFKYQSKDKIVTEFLNLHHPDLVRVVKYGTWSGRFYEAMEYCAGGMLSDYLPLNMKSIRTILSEIISGLRYLHDKDIIHRDIKPDNFYFRQPNMQDLVIGDFGISSLIDSDKHTHNTDTMAWTVDYTAPESFGNNLHKESDYYSLGITLIQTFLGVSPFKGYIRDAIVAAHMKGDIPNLEELPDDLRYLVTGLTQFKPRNRWGYPQVMQWLKGEQILNDAGLPWQEDLYSGKEVAYPSYKEAKTPTELARSLDKFDAQKDLFRGYISKWIFNDFHNSELAEKIEEIEENYGDNHQLGVIKLGFVLDPTLPLKINGNNITSVQELILLLKRNETSTNDALEQALFWEHIECWIEATQKVGGGNKSRLLQDIAKIRKRFSQTQALGLFVLLYTLDPQYPLVVDTEKNITIQRPEEIENLLSKNPDQKQNISNLFSNRYLEEWLRTTFTEDADRSAIAYRLERARSRYANDKELAIWVLRWCLTPELGFPFNKKIITTPDELAQILDQGPETWAKGIELIKSEHIRAWLTSSGRMTAENTSIYDKIIGKNEINWDGKLEAVLHILDPTLPSPKVAVDKTSLNLGKISIDGESIFTLKIRNSARGYLHGNISLTGNHNGITLDNTKIDGVTKQITGKVRTLGLNIGSGYNSRIVINTNGGDLDIPVNFKVRQKIATPKKTIISAALILLAIFIYTQTQQNAHYVSPHIKGVSPSNQSKNKESSIIICNTSSGLNLRSGPSTNNKIIGKISNGERVTSLDHTVSRGKVFLKVRKQNGVAGWAWAGNNSELFSKTNKRNIGVVKFQPKNLRQNDGLKLKVKINCIEKNKACGTFIYEELGCSGNLIYERSDNLNYFFSENVKTQNCVSGCKLSIAKNGKTYTERCGSMIVTGSF